MTFTARVPAALAYRPVVSEMVRAVCEMVERTERCHGLGWQVVSAFHEAFNNVVQHASGSEHSEVTVEVRVDAQQLVLELTDQGPGFDLDALDLSEPPKIDTLDRGGMGLFIIRCTMTTVRYERGSTNRLTMIKSLSECRHKTSAQNGSESEGTPC